QEIPGYGDVAAECVPRSAPDVAVRMRVNVHAVKSLQEAGLEITLHDRADAAGGTQMSSDHENAVARASTRTRGAEAGVVHARLLRHRYELRHVGFPEAAATRSLTTNGVFPDAFRSSWFVVSMR